MIRLLLLALLVWLPGALAWRAFGGDVRLAGSERRVAELVTGLCLTTFLATLLAELGIFWRVMLVMGWGLLCLALSWRLETGDWRLEIGDWRLEIGDWSSSPTSNLQSPIPNLFSIWTLGLIAVTVLAAVLFSRPAEAFLVVDDSGVYVIHGLTLARTGGLAIRDTVLASLFLSSTKAAQLFRFLRYEASFLRLEGFYIWNWGRGLVQPSFFHLPSIWMGVLALLGGPRAAVWAAPLAGLVGVAAMACLGRRLFGPVVGLAAALLLSVNFPQVWFARYPTSEVFAQAWLLGGLFLLAVFLQQRQPLPGVVAGLALGQLFLARVDGWIAALAVGLCFAGWRLWDVPAAPEAERVGVGWFLWPLGSTLVWAGFHAALFATSYVVSLMHLYLSPRLAAIAVPAALLVGLVVCVVLYRSDVLCRLKSRFATVYMPAWLAGLLLAGTWVAVTAFGTRANVRADALRWLYWYFTPWGLGAALIGLALMVRHGIPRPAQPVLLVALLYALLYLPAPRANLVLPWGVRRFVPAVIPGLALAMAYFVAHVPVPGPLRLRQTARGGMVLVLALALARNAQPVLAHDEFAGVWEQLAALARHFEPGSIVLFNRTGVGQAIAQPLTYLHDRPSFVLQADVPDPQILESLVTLWSAEGRSVYLALTGLAPWLADLDVGLQPAGEFTFRFPRLELSRTHPPRKTYTAEWRIDLYRLTPEGERAPVNRLDMGPGELPYLRSGFYDRETAPDGTTFRWTDGDGVITLPVTTDVSQLRLRVAGPPAGIPRPTLRAFIDGEVVGTWELPDGFVTLQAEIPPGAAADGRLEIELRSETWVPRQAGRGDDERRLGVVVDWVAVNSRQ